MFTAATKLQVRQLVSTGDLSNLQLFATHTPINNLRYSVTGIVKWRMATEPNHRIGGISPLLHAAAEGHQHIVRWLLEEGHADPAERTPENITALLWAAHGGYSELVSFLLGSGNSSLAECDSDGNTAMLCAAMGGQLQMVQWFITHAGVDLHELNNDMEDALILAIGFAKSYQVAQWLISQGGFNPTRFTCTRASALSTAAKHGLMQILTLLLTEGWYLTPISKDT
eukprot:TRINITY_DN3953_c0_g1_i1.p1 TRINITY_DN3953_c0_g1~~TRINITY_DN3953_c0_g1_i1.p1  ORF type:complete len:227 (-),score=20.72 TRINITY_DN3953_c0_g1_i1:4-684(-)